MAKRNRYAAQNLRPPQAAPRPEVESGQQDLARFYEFGAEPGAINPGVAGRAGQLSQTAARSVQVSTQYSGARAPMGMQAGAGRADQEAGTIGATGTAGSPSYQKAGQQGAAEVQRFQKTKQNLGGTNTQ